MGCRHYFVVDRLGELVDEGDSRSCSRAHEHDNFRLVSQQHVAIQILSEVDVHLVERCGRTDWMSNHNGSLCAVMIWIRVWLDWLVDFCLSNNF